MNLRRFLVSLVLSIVLVGCGHGFPQDVSPVSEVRPIPGGTPHVHVFADFERAIANVARLRTPTQFTAAQDGGSELADGGSTVVLPSSVDAGVILVPDGGVAFAPGSRSVLRFVVNQASLRLPASCPNPGFEIWSQVMEGNPPNLTASLSYRAGFATDVQVIHESNFSVFSKFFCQLDGGMPIDIGGGSDPACYTASIPEFFSELALYELDGGVTDMRVEYRSITYLGKVRVSDTPTRVVPATFCVDGGH